MKVVHLASSVVDAAILPTLETCLSNYRRERAGLGDKAYVRFSDLHLLTAVKAGSNIRY